MSPVFGTVLLRINDLQVGDLFKINKLARSGLQGLVARDFWAQVRCGGASIIIIKEISL